jgi:hypothetical protein
MMSKQISNKNLDLLRALADYQLLTITQATVLFFASRQMARRHFRELYHEGLIEISYQDLNKTKGKPEGLIRLSHRAADLLKEQGLYENDVYREKTASFDHDAVEHQLLINWARIHLIHMERCLARLKVNFLSPAFHHEDYILPLSDLKLGLDLVPDGIFSISDNIQFKPILFFLEVDMGTESLTSKSSLKNNLNHKIIAYQDIFRTTSYKRLEIPLNASFLGFRTLFVANTLARYEQICRLTKSIKNTDFIWVTHKDHVFGKGISDMIWARGGHSENDPQSILGPTLGFKRPLELPQ